MYVEERMYVLQIGKAAEYFKNYEEFGMKVAAQAPAAHGRLLRHRGRRR